MSAEKMLLGLAEILRHYPYKGKTFFWKTLTQSFPQNLRGDCVIHFPEGYRMKLSLEDQVQRMMLASCYERRTNWFLKRLLRPGDCFFDGGAYVGHYSCFAAACSAPGRVDVFEPNPQMIPILNEQIALNPGLKIRIHELALSDDCHSQVLHLPEWMSSLAGQAHASLKADSSRKGNWREIKVNTVTLDEFIKTEKISKVELCKMDLEGGEPQALRGAASSLRSGILESLILEVTEENKEALANELELYDFEIVQDLRFNRPCGSLRNLKKIGIYYATNVLFARGAAAERWKKINFSKWFV